MENPTITQTNNAHQTTGWVQTFPLPNVVTSTNIPMIYKKMIDIMKDVGFIGKNQKNSAQGYSFRGIDDLLNSLSPALTKNGVFIIPRCTNHSYEMKDVTRGNGKPGVDKHVNVMMEYSFYAEDGSSITVGPIPAEGYDSGDKATNKALSAALKYCLIQAFSIPTVGQDDGDLESPEIASTPSQGTKKASFKKSAQPVTANSGW